MWAIILWIVMFMFLVIIHELGHFLAAKKSGVHVYEFGVWIPPKVAKLWKDKGWTEYTINWIPLGWFVRLKWEDPSDEEEFLAKDSFITTSLFNKIVILLWWVIVNALFAWIAFTVAFWAGTSPITIIPDWVMESSNSYLMPSVAFAQEKWLATFAAEVDNVVIAWIKKWSLAESMKLKDWATITAVNWVAVTPWTIQETIQNTAWTITIDMKEKWSDTVTMLTGTCVDNPCTLWIWIEETVVTFGTIKMPLWQAMWASLQEMRAESKMTMSALWKLWKWLLSFNRKEISSSVNNLSWPVMIVAIGQRLFYENGWVGYLAFAWIISLALALFNILPIPALDWWRIVSVLIQAVGRFSPTKYFTIENYVNVVVFVALMIFGLVIMYKDIVIVAWW